MTGHARTRVPVATRHARVPHTPRRAPALVLTAALTAVASTAAAVYADLSSQMDVSNAQELVLTPATPVSEAPPDDPFAGSVMNVLVMGTDLRDAENAALAGFEEGMRSDTTMLVHVAGDRSWVEVVSIPRDSYVPIPECLRPDGSRSRPERNKFNASFSNGAGAEGSIEHAAACTIGTVQALTGVTVTHHVVVRMTGVIDVVDALGGVTMCLPEPVVEDRRFGSLELPAGQQKLHGQQAISFLRARKGKGMGLELGSDLMRIQRQQAFVQAATRELLGKNVLGDADELYGVARAVLGALTADPQLRDPVRLASFGYSLRGLERSHVVFTQLPVVDDPQNESRVLWTSGADEIWQRIATDTPPPVIAGPPATTGEPGVDDPGAGEQAGDPAAGGGADPAAPGGEGAPAGPEGTPPDTGVAPPAEEVLPGVCPT